MENNIKSNLKSKKQDIYNFMQDHKNTCGIEDEEELKLLFLYAVKKAFKNTGVKMSESDLVFIDKEEIKNIIGFEYE